MPFVIAALVFLAAVIYGAVRFYATVAAHFGLGAAIVALAVCAALIAALAAGALRRHRAIHGVSAKGERRLHASDSWGSLQLDATRKTGALTVAQESAQFVFSDIVSAAPAKAGATWTLVVCLRHQPRSEWTLPMPNQREAKRWAKVFSLASAQKL